MTKEDLEELGSDLYQELLLDHYKNPRNAGTIPEADIAHDADNPTCGDEVHVFARVKDEKVADIRFQGKGCAISQASASILFEDIKGKSLGEIQKLNLPHVQDLLGITVRPARVKCATLGLVVIHEGIKEYRARNKPKKALPGFARK